MEKIETAGVALPSVENLHFAGNPGADLGGIGGERCQAALDHLFFAVALDHLGALGFELARQMVDRGQDGLKLDEAWIRLAQLLLQRLDLVPQQRRVLLRGNREGAIVIAQHQRAIHEGESELAPLEHNPVLIAEDREENLVLQLFCDRVPIDVEVLGVERSGAIFEHVVPPGIAAIDPHVVGNEIEQLAQAPRLERGTERGVLLRGADLRIESVVVYHVVPVRAARRRLEVWRGVDVADAEPFEVWNEERCIRESEALVKLEPIGRKRRGAPGEDGFLERGKQSLGNHRGVESLGGDYRALFGALHPPALRNSNDKRLPQTKRLAFGGEPLCSRRRDGQSAELLIHQLGHLEHRYLLLSPKYRTELVIGVDHPTLLGVLEVVLLDIRPEFLDDLGSRYRLVTDDFRQHR